MILGKELRRRVKKHQAMSVVTLADSEVQAEWHAWNWAATVTIVATPTRTPAMSDDPAQGDGFSF